MRGQARVTIDGEIKHAYEAMYAAADKVQVLLIERHLRAKRAAEVLAAACGEKESK